MAAIPYLVAKMQSDVVGVPPLCRFLGTIALVSSPQSKNPHKEFKLPTKIRIGEHMRSPAWKLISKMLSAEEKGSPSSEMLDVIRVLVVYNGAGWKSELIRELSFLRKFKNESEIESGLVEKALRKLKEEGYIMSSRPLVISKV